MFYQPSFASKSWTNKLFVSDKVNLLANYMQPKKPLN